jgi:predicted nucleic acid-binding protein
VIVLDASATVDLLVDVEPNAGWVAAAVAREQEWHCPELIDPEVLHALRRHLAVGDMSVSQASAAVSDLAEMPLVRYPHLPFVARAWELRAQLTAYDALYVALAEALGATLVTTDHRLGRAVTTVDVSAPA